jgi:hypothetical protein
MSNTPRTDTPAESVPLADVLPLVEALRLIAANPGNCDDTGFMSGHASRGALAAFYELHPDLKP